MASPAGSARRGARGRALVLALVVCALALAALVAILSRGGVPARPPTAAPHDGAPAPAEARAEPPTTNDVDHGAGERAALADDTPIAPAGPLLRGLLLGEDGVPIDGRTARVTLRGPLGQWLELGADAQGRFGPQRLVAGTWSVSASSSGRRGASREVEAREDTPLDPLRLVLPRVRLLEVCLLAVGPGSDGNPNDDLEGFERLLSLRLSVAGEASAMQAGLSQHRNPSSGDRQWFARFEVPQARSATAELLLGGEFVLQWPIGPEQSELVVSVDPRDLAARLVELELALVGAQGQPLANVSHVLLTWAGGVHLSAGQPGPEPARAHFEACPPGPARLRVVDVDGRRGEVDLFVPYASPARLEVALELVEPARD